MLVLVNEEIKTQFKYTSSGIYSLEIPIPKDYKKRYLNITFIVLNPRIIDNSIESVDKRQLGIGIVNGKFIDY